MRHCLILLAAATLSIAVPGAAAPRDQAMPSSAEAANRNLIETAFTRWAAGGYDIFDLLADDVTWHIAGQDPAIAKTYRSKDALLAATSRPLRARLAGPLRPEVRRIWTDGDDVIIHWDGTAPMAHGATYRNTYLWIMKVSRDRVVAVTAFLDNAAFKAALGKPLPPGQRD